MSAVNNAEPATTELAPTALAGVPAARAARPPRRDALPDSPSEVESSLGNRAPVFRPVPPSRVPSARTRSEARLVFRAPLVGDEDDGWDGRRFSLLEVTSGLPDDSRASDEHERTRVEAQRRGRTRAALEALEAHPAARDLVLRDQTKLRQFCARFSVRPSDICPKGDVATERCDWCRGSHGVFRPVHVGDLTEIIASPSDRLAELRAREAACFPGSEV